jgi:hypothetical protein
MQLTNLARYEAKCLNVLYDSHVHWPYQGCVGDRNSSWIYISDNLNDGMKQSCHGPAEFSSMSDVIPRPNSYKCQMSSTHFCCIVLLYNACSRSCRLPWYLRQLAMTGVQVRQFCQRMLNLWYVFLYGSKF